MLLIFHLLTLFLTNLSSAVKVEVLHPVMNSTTEAALIITPGAEIRGQAYRATANAIQANSTVRLWAVLLEDFLKDKPNILELSSGVDMAVAELKKLGMKSSANVFLAGHGFGGKLVSEYAQSSEGKLKGVLLFAAYLSRGNPLNHYPVPLLTLSGDLDGLTRITRIVDTFEELQNDMKENSTALYRTPVIVMSGVNHGQFASGTMPPKIRDHDINPEVTVDEAQRMIAKHVNNFLTLTLMTQGAAAIKARRELEDEFNKTSDMLIEFSMVKGWDANPDHSSVWSVQIQQLIIGDLVDYVKVHDREVSQSELPKIQPSTKNDSSPTIQTYTTVVMPSDPEDDSFYPKSPLELKAKMKNQDSARELLPGVKVPDENMTCSDYNKMTVYLLLYNVPDYIKQRHQEHGGKLIANDVVLLTNATEWYTRPLELGYLDDGSMNMTSYAFTTPTNYPDKDLAGMYFCTLISPYRALEWLAIDSLIHR